MPEKCDNLRDLMKCEMRIIKKHLDEHKWFNHIEGENEGVKDFIEKYGWLMRELYCGYACKKRDRCEIVKNHLEK